MTGQSHSERRAALERERLRIQGEIVSYPMPIPACDTTPCPSADTFTRGATAIFFTCEVPSRQDL